MKVKTGLIMVVCFFIGSSAWALKIPKSEIQVVGTQGWCCVASKPDYGDPANTIDGDINSYWNGTNGLMTGDTNFSAYKFNIRYSISQINFHGEPVPVPEPATILLLGSGLIGLAGFIRKIKK